MAIIKQGINGPISGKVGGIVTYQLNGQNIARSLPSYTKRKPSELTLINRGRMSAVSKFLRPIKRIIAFGYKYMSPPGSRVGTFQTAQSYLLKNAIAYGEGNTPYVDPSKVLVFRGTLAPPVDLKAERSAHAIHLSWDNTLCKSSSEVLVILGYTPNDNFSLFENGAGKASQGSYEWSVGERWLGLGTPIYIYVAFYDIVWDKLSDSAYALCI